MNTIWYFPLEAVKSRYTQQLCGSWIPDAINEANSRLHKKVRYNFVNVVGEVVETDIKVGCVLDATGRGIFSLTQSSQFLKLIRENKVQSGDVIYVQDFWTPGLEAIQYALDLYNINVKWYTMLHAQSVDEYDFTYQMRRWMRNVELGYDSLFSTGGIFVGSSIHKKQLREAGFKAPIYVVSLPLGYTEVQDRIKLFTKNTEKSVVFSSRLDNEKQPFFMLSVAKKFLDANPDWKFIVTTSGKQLRSNNINAVDAIYKFAKNNNRFIIKENLTKDQYYEILCNSKIQLNTSLQDYVSWTLLEATTCGCDICYPNFRSFPECVPKDRLYKAFDVDSCIKLLNKCIKHPRVHNNIAIKSNYGRIIEGLILTQQYNPKKFNIWKHSLDELEKMFGE
jgi:glycosyltransferase involved in cell wall biosynthesis